MSSTGLKIEFINKTGLKDEEVFVSFENPSKGTTHFGASYQPPRSAPDTKMPKRQDIRFRKTDDLMSVPVSLHDLSSAVTATEFISVVVFVSYGKALTSTSSAPSYIGAGADDYDTPFQNFEVTYTGAAGDQADLTAINYITAPMSMESYSNGTLQQSAGFTKTKAGFALPTVEALALSYPDCQIDLSGGFVRLVGPSSYGTSTSPWPSMKAYALSMKDASPTPKLANHNAFNVPPGAVADGSVNYDFAFDTTLSVGADGSLTLSGDVSVTATSYSGTPASASKTEVTTFKNTSVTVSATDLAAYNFALYGQVISDAVSFNEVWTKDIKAYCTKVGLDPQGAFDITQRMVIGEISSGILMGYVNSEADIPGSTTKKYKDLPSQTWWTLSPVKAFSDVQADHPYYNVYANAIYRDSNNTVYSIPYSDRLGTGPLVNTVQYEGNAIDTIKITLGPPLKKKP